MPGINDDIADSIISTFDRVLRYAELPNQHILAILDELQRELAAAILEIDPLGVGAITYQQARQEKLLKLTNSLISRAYGKNNAVLDKSLQALVPVDAKATTQLLNDAIGFNITSATFTPEQIQALSRKTMLEGATSREWWSKQSRDLQESFTREIRMGMMQGESNQEMIQRIRGTATGRSSRIRTASGEMVTVRQYTGGIMQTTNARATALVRTAVNAVSNETRMLTFTQNADVIEAVAAVVTLDTRTSLICQGRSGGIWNLETGKPTKDSAVKQDFPGPPPWHFNCRTTLTPVTKTWEQIANEANAPQLKKLKELPESTRASMDGQVPESWTYQEWLKRQTKARQIEALGPARYELWNSEKVDLRQLTDRTGRPLTLAELEKTIN